MSIALDWEVVKRDKQSKGFKVLPWRWLVERTLAWLVRYRRLSINLRCPTCNVRSLHLCSYGSADGSAVNVTYYTFQTSSERHKWVSDKLHRIDAGDVRQVIRTLKEYRGQGQERITNLSKYLKRFRDAVNYDEFRAKGLPIGSGEVESAITLYFPKAPKDSRSYLASRYG